MHQMPVTDRKPRPVQMGEQMVEDNLIAFSVEKVYWADKVVPAEPAGNTKLLCGV